MRRHRTSLPAPEPTVVKSDDEWRNQLTNAQYAVLRRAATERPFAGEYVHSRDDGVYRCAGCGAALFSSDEKFESGTGWPSFTDPVTADSVTLVRDRGYFTARTEVRCRACGSHLGHVFRDGPTRGGHRYCINSCSLDLDRSAETGR